MFKKMILVSGYANYVMSPNFPVLSVSSVKNVRTEGRQGKVGGWEGSPQELVCIYA